MTNMAKKKKKNDQQEKNTDSKEDVLEFQGVIEEAMPGTLFRVGCENGHKVIATLSGKLRMNRIRILPGDQVRVEVSVYDPQRGRISWRF